MTCAEFVDIYKPSLKRQVWQLACRYSKCAETREDYCQEAWLWIGAAPADKTIEYYLEVAYKAIRCIKDYDVKHRISIEEAADYEMTRLWRLANLMFTAPEIGGQQRFTVEKMDRKR